MLETGEFDNDIDIPKDSIKWDISAENPSENPWNVSNASEFLKYCCPECEYSNQNLHDFSDHALENHVLSNTLFNDRTNNHDKSEIPSDSKVDDIKVEPSIEMYENNVEEDDIKSEFPTEGNM